MVFCYFYVILIASTNVTSDQATVLCNAILVTEICCYRYSTIINSAKNNIFQQNLIIVLAIYCRLSEQSFIQIRSDLTF